MLTVLPTALQAAPTALLPRPRRPPQGINDLATPFFVVFLQEATGAPDAAVYSGTALAALDAAQLRRVEADCYHCLTKMLDLAQVRPRGRASCGPQPHIPPPLKSEKSS